MLQDSTWIDPVPEENRKPTSACYTIYYVYSSYIGTHTEVKDLTNLVYMMPTWHSLCFVKVKWPMQVLAVRKI